MSKNKKLCAYIGVFLVGILIFLIVTPFRFLSMPKELYVFVSIPLSTLLFAALTAYAIRRFRKTIRPAWIFLTVLCSLLVFNLPVRIADFNGSLGSLPEFVIQVLGIVLGYLYGVHKLRLWAAVAIAATPMAIYGSIYKNYGMWCSLGTYTGNISDAGSEIPDFKIVKENGDTLRISDFRGKWIVFDCWFQGCGFCFDLFPEFQDFYDEMRTENNVYVSALFFDLAGNENENGKMLPEEVAGKYLRTNGYTFTSSVLADISTADSLKVEGFPIVLIINPRGQLVYRGKLDFVKDRLKEWNAITKK